MKKQFYTLGLLVLFIVGSQLMSFVDIRNNKNTALAQITQQFHIGLTEFENSIEKYAEYANKFENTEASIKHLQNIHTSTRLAFKDVEFLLEYYDREGIKKTINGAPLPTIEPKVPEIRVIEPIGLQVLDEIVYSEDPFAEKEAINEYVYKLKRDYKLIKNHQQSIRIQSRHVFEATRQELVRIFSLGLTGFDTPGSLNAVPEAMHAINALASAMKAYNPQLPKGLSKEISTTFSKAIQYLEDHQEFETFNRLVFLKEYINPLYELIYKVHRELQIETYEEVADTPLATNYHTTNIFDEDFLNPSFYANLNKNELTDKRLALGRILFFDPVLSATNKSSCATCHQPEKAFTDGMKKSLALNGEGTILRNAPTVINSIYAERYFYDLREPSMERQIKHVVRDRQEFNTDFFEIAEELSQSEEYKQLFAEAYPNSKYQLSKWSISNALTTYIVSLKAFNSPFDQYVRGETSHIDPSVENGFNIFMGKGSCGTCHFAPNFSGIVPPNYTESESEILGVPSTKDEVNPEIDWDEGRYMSSRPQDRAPFYVGSFKTPTVRNVGLTAPYMHNGVYDNLEEVVVFYNKGGGLGLGLDVPYQTLPRDSLGLNDKEIKDVVAFMEALTDTVGLTVKPSRLPKFPEGSSLNKRVVGGDY